MWSFSLDHSELTTYDEILQTLVTGSGVVSVVVNTTACDPSELPNPIQDYDVVVGVPSVETFFVAHPDGNVSSTFASSL